jgi:GT2 family glycosyltransferase
MSLPTVVIATHNRRERLLATLARLRALPERPRILVVDNASSDGTAAAVRRRYRGVEVIESAVALGAAARTLAVEAADTRLVAFSDDDSWWAPGALVRAAELFEAFPRLGLIAARIVVEPYGHTDPTCCRMEASPLDDEPDLPGSPVIGFLACGAIARRAAVLECGGFHARYGFGGEEHLLAVDLAVAGWGLAYVEEVLAHHQPVSGPRGWQGPRGLRNELWSTWLRRPLPRATRLTVALAARGQKGSMRGLASALRGLPWVMRERRVVPSHVERRLRLLDDSR